MKQSPYLVEYTRQRLAAERKLNELKRMYSRTFPEIPDVNSAHFWDKRQYTRERLAQQDAMTRDRVKIATDFVPRSAKRILDIGIGHGWAGELLEKRRDLMFYGNDISPRTIQNIKERFEGHFTVQSIYELDYKPHFFDAVLLLEVLEHVPSSKTFGVLKDIWNLLLPNGHLILSVPTNEGLDRMPDNPSGHVRMYTIPLVTAELELSGFEVLRVKTLYAFNRYVLLKKLIARIAKARWQPNDIIVLAQKA